MPAGAAGALWRGALPAPTLLAVASHGGAPYLCVYQRNGDTLTRITPGPADPGDAHAVAWSPDGVMLAVASFTTPPYLAVYQRAGTILTPVPVPAGTNDGANAVAWSPDGRTLALGSTGSPPLTFYARLAGNQITLAPAVPAPPSEIMGLDWSPDGALLAVAAEDGLYVYAPGAATLHKAATVQPSSAVAWSPDGALLAGCSTAGLPLRTYTRTGDTVTFTQNLGAPGAVYGVCWSPDGQLLLTAGRLGTGVTAWSRTGSTLTRLADPVTSMTTPDGRSIAFSNDLVAFASATAPYLTCYRRQDTVLIQLAGVPTVAPGAGPRGVAWSPV